MAELSHRPKALIHIFLRRLTSKSFPVWVACPRMHANWWTDHSRTVAFASRVPRIFGFLLKSRVYTFSTENTTYLGLYLHYGFISTHSLMVYAGNDSSKRVEVRKINKWLEKWLAWKVWKLRSRWVPIYSLTSRIDLKVETQQKGRFCGFTEHKCESLSFRPSWNLNLGLRTLSQLL